MEEKWLNFEEFKMSYPEEKYHIIEIIRFNKGDIDSALEKISKLTIKLVNLDIDADLVTVSNFSKRSQTRIIRSKTRRKATMREKYVKTYYVPDFPIVLALAIDKEKATDEEVKRIKEKIDEILERVV